MALLLESPPCSVAAAWAGAPECTGSDKELPIYTPTCVPDDFGSDKTRNSTLDESAFDTVSEASSSEEWLDPGNVLLFVDWDDTLFPTTWLKSNKRFARWTRGELPLDRVLTGSERAMFEELDATARAFVVAAGQFAKIVCVTLSRRGWVESTLAFLPKLSAAWKELGVEVRYASEEKLRVQRSCVGQWVRQSRREEEALMADKYTKQKKRSMHKALRKFYGQGHSWKNAVSIGDGNFEAQALKDIAFGHSNPTSSKTGQAKDFRIRTVKLADSPPLSQLRDQLQVVQAWLPKIIAWRSDIDVDLGEELGLGFGRTPSGAKSYEAESPPACKS